MVPSGLWQDACMSEPPEAGGLLQAFSRARQGAEQHMMSVEEDDETWDERTITDHLLQDAKPFVKYAAFNQRQEPVVGADWLWWWVDNKSDESFGMLVQAKKLKRDGPSWSIDFGYNKGAQRKALFEAADVLGVPPVYVLYMGSFMHMRADVTCGDKTHLQDTCARCIKAAVSVMPGLITSYMASRGDDVAEQALQLSIPLEHLADPAMQPDKLWIAETLGITDSDLFEFLATGQHGPRQVAKMLFQRVNKVRFGQFSAALADRVHVEAPQVFPNLPADTGHFGVPYFQHILRGLRAETPRYVHDVLAGLDVPGWLIETGIAGIAVVDIRTLSTTSDS